jgi:hypothetical protein
MPAQPSKVLYLRGISADLSRKVKALAALSDKTISEYIGDLLKTHVADVERKGQLPKSK